MRQELGDRTRYDQTISTDDTKLKRWLNMAQQYICGRHNWPFMLKEEIVQTTADITTGTVSINAADTALTFSSAPTPSVQGRYIKFTASGATDDWYEITAHTAGQTNATISPAYVGSANLSGATYEVRKLLYSTSTPLLQILDMKQLITPVRLISQSPRETDYFLPLYYDEGNPYYYIMSSPDSTGKIQFSLLRSPDSTMNIMVRGIRALTDMSGDTDTTLVPVQWHDGLINIAAYYAFQGLDDSRAKTELEIGEERIRNMEMVLSHDLGRHRIMQPVDNDSNFGLQWALPSDFGPEVPF
jgi:hypothetical protein